VALHPNVPAAGVENIVFGGHRVPIQQRLTGSQDQAVDPPPQPELDLWSARRPFWGNRGTPQRWPFLEDSGKPVISGLGEIRSGVVWWSFEDIKDN